jgi:hypothetical protein
MLRGASRVLAILGLLLVAVPRSPRAHEIPNDVTVRAFVAPRGHTLSVLVRVPLVSMRDFDFPLYGPGYLDVAAVQPMLRDAATMWIAEYVEMFEDGTALGRPMVTATRISLPSNRSFGSYQQARDHLDGDPLPPASQLPWEQALLDVMLEYTISADTSHFSMRPVLAHLGIRTLTVLRFLPADGTERVFQYTGNPGLVELDPRWHQATLRFIGAGFHHIMDGIDHLLFLLCLVIPVRRFWALVPIVTAFTVAHSITLIASATGLAPNALWFPPLIETLIAASIVFMALENIVGARLRHRWIMAFGFGLVHGFGFSFVLSETMQFAGSHLLTSLLAFNVGVELGQLAVLAVVVPLLALVLGRAVPERTGVIVLSALVAHTGWHWMTERGAQVMAYDFAWPVWQVSGAVVLMRWAMLLLIVVGAAWLLNGLFRRFVRPEAVGGAPSAERSPVG